MMVENNEPESESKSVAEKGAELVKSKAERIEEEAK